MNELLHSFDLIYYLDGIALYTDFPRVRLQSIITFFSVGHLLPILILPCKSTQIEYYEKSISFPRIIWLHIELFHKS